MAPLPSFTIDPNTTITEILGQVAGSELSESSMTSARLRFTSNILDGFVVWEGDIKRVLTVEAYVNTAGTIERFHEDGGSGPVMLLANNPGLNATNIQWTVDIVIGRTSVKKWTFTGPLDGQLHNLALSIPEPAQKVGRGPASYLRAGGINDDGELVFVNDDGSSFAVAIPSGTLAMIDNGDSTWTFVG